MLYLVDTSSLLEAKETYYALDFIPYFWNWLEAQGRQGNIKIPTEAYDELKVDNGEFGVWVRTPSVKAALHLGESLTADRVNRVLDTYGTALSERELETCSDDAHILSYCLDSQSRCIITDEVSRPSRQRANRKMPDVAKDLGITSTTLVAALRKLRFCVP